ncbi:MAG: alpha/beta hydrolase, partial [Chloroflexota bacterium]
TSTPTASSTPTPISTQTPTPTALPTHTATATPTATPLPTSTPTVTPTATLLPTNTPTATSTATPLPTNTPTSAPTATPLPTNTPPPTATPLPTETPLPTSTPITGQPLRPILECVAVASDGSFIAFFGYRNDNEITIDIPIGSSNYFTPWPHYRGQPTSFLPGRQYAVFWAYSSGYNLVWHLDGRTATAGSGGPPCGG